jgi:L-cysteine/cystine lyase
MNTAKTADLSPRTDLVHYRQQFPALAVKHYFNYGGQGPMPEAAIAALETTQRQIQQQGPFSNQVNRWLGQLGADLRQSLGTELGVGADTLTLTENVTVGCNIPLWGLDWQAGDHVLMGDCEHPGVIATVQEIGRRFGVSISTCPLMATVNQPNPDQAAADVIAAHLQPQTRLVVVSHILWNTGQVLPLTAIADLCHHQPRPVLLLADAAQSVGMLPLNLAETGVDFYAFTGHKWLCGPAGVGGLYIAPAALDQVRPTFIGWRSVTSDSSGHPVGFQSNGQRYEVATSDYPLYASLNTAIATHAEWGNPEDRYQRICQLSQTLWQRLGEQPNLRPLRTTPPDSGLISFEVLDNGEPSPALHKHLVNQLEAQGSLLRTLLYPNCVRACLHYFSLETEVEALVAEIQEVLAVSC